MNSEKGFFGFDILLLLSTLTLAALGIFFIYSSGIDSNGNLDSNEYIKQIIWLLLGIGLLFLIILLDYKILRENSLQIYLVLLATLAITLLVGQRINGAKSWIGIPALGIGIQPSEFTKLATIFFLAKYTADNKNRVEELQFFLEALGITLLPLGLILVQPDMGTGSGFYSHIPVYHVHRRSKKTLYILSDTPRCPHHHSCCYP
jgi:rod shape determining protein RodA